MEMMIESLCKCYIVWQDRNTITTHKKKRRGKESKWKVEYGGSFPLKN